MSLVPVSRRWLRPLTALAFVATLLGCGGGGGGPSTREPLPTLVQDTVPAGARIDVAARNYFVGAPGDYWNYAVAETGGNVSRSVSAASGGDLLITETGGGATGSETLRRTAEGVLLLQPLADIGVPVGDVLSSLLIYPEPFYPVGGERVAIRQGTLGQDLDGDGSPDSFRLEFRQVLVGFETLTLPDGPTADVAHFRDVIRITVRFSDPANDDVTVVGTENSWWAPGIGMVRAERSVADADGRPIEAPQTLSVSSGSVGGQLLFAPRPDGTVTKIPLTHRALVHDAARGRYYASVPSGSSAQPNTIASIDAVTGAVSHSAPIGANPGPLALSADASRLYVGLDGSGEVLQLRLPDLAELSRTRLPSPPGDAQWTAESITVSPLDPGVAAVAMQRVATSPRHTGVALIRDGVLQARTTPGHTGSNVVVFADDGSAIYGFNSETTEYGLRRIALLADGLEETLVVPAGDGSGFGSGTLSMSPHGLLHGRQRRQLPDLALLGSYAADGAGCRWHGPRQRVVCLGDTGGGFDRFIVVADPVGFGVESRPVFLRGYSQESVVELVPGPSGQVALRFGLPYAWSPSSEIWLFTTPALQ